MMNAAMLKANKVLLDWEIEVFGESFEHLHGQEINRNKLMQAIAREIEKAMVEGIPSEAHEKSIRVAAQLWCKPKHAHKEMDPEFCASISQEIDKAFARGKHAQIAAMEICGVLLHVETNTLWLYPLDAVGDEHSVKDCDLSGFEYLGFL